MYCIAGITKALTNTHAIVYSLFDRVHADTSERPIRIVAR